jgi:hypothetical protein
MNNQELKTMFRLLFVAWLLRIALSGATLASLLDWDELLTDERAMAVLDTIYVVVMTVGMACLWWLMRRLPDDEDDKRP